MSHGCHVTYCYMYVYVVYTQDEAYEYFIQHGVFPGKRQPPLSDSGKWLVRFNIVFWFLAVLVLPMTVMLLTLSWSTLATLLVAGSIGE